MDYFLTFRMMAIWLEAFHFKHISFQWVMNYIINLVPKSFFQFWQWWSTSYSLLQNTGRNHIPIMQNNVLRTNDPILYLYRVFVYPTVPHSSQLAIYEVWFHRSTCQSKTMSPPIVVVLLGSDVKLELEAPCKAFNPVVSRLGTSNFVRVSSGLTAKSESDSLDGDLIPFY